MVTQGLAKYPPQEWRAQCCLTHIRVRIIRSTWDLKRIKSFIEHRTEKKKNAWKKNRWKNTLLWKLIFIKYKNIHWREINKIFSPILAFCYRIGLSLENTKMVPLAGNTPDDFQILNWLKNLGDHKNDDSLNWFSARPRHLLFCNEFHAGVKSPIISHDFSTKTNIESNPTSWMATIYWSALTGSRARIINNVLHTYEHWVQTTLTSLLFEEASHEVSSQSRRGAEDSACMYVSHAPALVWLCCRRFRVTCKYSNIDSCYENVGWT